MAETKINHAYEEVVFNDQWKNEYDEKYWNYRKMWSQVPVEKLKTEFPMHLDMEITNVCNLKCPMCPRTLMINKGIELKPYFLDIKVFEKAIDMGYKKGLYAVNLNAAGETLFHRDTVKMVEYAKQKGVLDVMFHTNATMLTEEISEGLIKAGLDKLIISIDSPYKEHYERIRVGASYDKVIYNTKKFIELRQKLNKKLPQVRINMVVMKENVKEIDEMINQWKDCVDSMGFLDCINPCDLDDDNRNIHDAKYDNSFICEKLWQRLTIGYNGEIKMCHMNEKDFEIIGNIFEDDICDVWNGEKMNHYRQLHLNGRIAEIPSCRVCGMPAVR